MADIPFSTDAKIIVERGDKIVLIVSIDPRSTTGSTQTPP